MSAHPCSLALQVVEWDEVKFDVRLMQRVPCTQPHPNPNIASSDPPRRCSPVCFVMCR